MGFVAEYSPTVRADAVDLLLDGLRKGLSIVDAAAVVHDVHGVSRQRLTQWARADGHVLRPTYAAMEAAQAEIRKLRRQIDVLSGRED
ncbi:hypothetical protein CXF35_00655 [Corynebacterium bovis]|uniref:Transposase n=2 Tax=Corynebacterium bovis TaxID=36808 RepID=A0A426Q412_9CORY|nr:transposase [Corynebacterium bovis]MBB3116977.1 hypothetical protein [Corynebacterium bovis DSM 20582 = CIP 54.80]QQC48648.1 hypothetical protein I6I09_10780 [Corynebacterium bovis]RRO92668.1 hypothetical protein CXF40_03050 [Corynebacterium bovis]RRO98651.1 hypothetical protein CXF32_00450 [Corynebacterium bovis]RRO99700.1 hypothetical protein CXF41_09070 [Corynebacterium bovis]